MKILIVDDDPCIARGIKRGLIGDEVAVCDSAEAALAAVADAEAIGVPFDVVLTDMKMPGMSGLDVIAALRARTRQGAPILILMTGDDDTAMNAVVADAVLVKPFHAVSLREAIAHVQERWGQAGRQRRASRASIRPRTHSATLTA